MQRLPSKDRILEACRAAPGNGHPVLESAHLLAGLHARRLRTEPESAAAPAPFDDIDQHRARLVLVIDRWIATELPPAHGGANMHTETVGAVIDRIARLSVFAHETLSNAPEWRVHDAWERLAELSLGYEDLAAEVSVGFRRLPRPYPSSRT